MPNQPATRVIPFPRRRAAVQADAAASGNSRGTSRGQENPTGQENLTRALEALNAALAAQQIAIAAWRASLSELKHTTETLSGGLRRYHSNLGSLGTRVASLRREATQLEAWADNVLQR
jgi:ABC-type transporter Mla subunit MlaD